MILQDRRIYKAAMFTSRLIRRLQLANLGRPARRRFDHLLFEYEPNAILFKI